MKTESNPNRVTNRDGAEVQSSTKNILSLCSDVNRYVDPTNPEFHQYNHVIELYCYWRCNHKSGMPPSRRDIDPKTDIPNLVKSLMMIDVVGQAYSYRFVGDEVTAVLGRDVTGRPVGSIGEGPAVVQQWRSALDLVVRERRPLLVTTHLYGPTKAQNAALLLPLVSTWGVVEIVLAGFFCDEHFTSDSSIEGLTVKEFRLSAKPDRTES